MSSDQDNSISVETSVREASTLCLPQTLPCKPRRLLRTLPRLSRASFGGIERVPTQIAKQLLTPVPRLSSTSRRAFFPYALPEARSALLRVGNGDQAIRSAPVSDAPERKVSCSYAIGDSSFNLGWKGGLTSFFSSGEGRADAHTIFFMLPLR